MSFISAVSPNRGLVAVYSNSQTRDINTNANTGTKRLVIKCYDSSVSIGALKFTLSANLSKLSSSSSSSKDSSASTAIVRKLQFSSNECLLVSVQCSASADTQHVLVFDLNRGVHSQTVDLSSSSSSTSSSPSTSSSSPGELCATTARDNLIYALYKKECKTMVVIHDIRKEGKVIHKVKCGSCEENDGLRLAVHPNAEKGLMAVWIGKKVKIVQIQTGKSPGKFKVKSNDGGNTYRHAQSRLAKHANIRTNEEERELPLLFSSDGNIVIAATPNGAHIFSIKSWEKVGTVDATDISGVHLHSHQGKLVGAIVSNHGTKVSVVEIHTLSNQKKNVKIKPTSTITLPSSASKSASKSKSSDDAAHHSKIIKEAFFAAGGLGASEVHLLELTPRGMNRTNADVDMVQVHYRDYESNQFQSGELYPTSDTGLEGDHDKRKGGTGTTAGTMADSKKRKTPNTNVVLGPGESGGEAMIVTDQTAIKRPKVNNNDNDHNDDKSNGESDDFVLEQGDEAEETIAQRLALLSSELDRDTEDEEELLKIQTEAAMSKSKNLIKGGGGAATSDSLAILLQQSLAAN